MAWIRWIAVIPAAVAGWWSAVIVAIAVHGFVFSFCPPEDVVSGACIAPWFLRFKTALLYSSVALSAILVVLVPTVMAPAHRRLVAWVAYAAGAVAAVALGGWLAEVVVALVSGFIAAFVMGRLYARRVA